MNVELRGTHPGCFAAKSVESVEKARDSVLGEAQECGTV
jgi:hypothetical protein